MDKGKLDILQTVAGKSAILLCNFLVVILTARLWGAEGRGVVAMFVADIGLLAIVGSVFTGSSVSYFLKKMGGGRLFAMALCWLAITSAVGAVLFNELGSLSVLPVCFFVISFFLGLLSFLSSMFLGVNKIKHYNVLTVLQPLLLLLLLLLFYWFVDQSYVSYFYAWVVSVTLLTLVSLWFQRKELSQDFAEFNLKDVFLIFKFGFQTQLSEFLQFFNTRLSFYFLAYYAGNASLGVFSIGVALSESVLVVARSISMVQYSRIVSEVSRKGDARREINKGVGYCVFFTITVLIVANVLPADLFIWVFGEDFADVKRILLGLSPGILAGSVANIIGHYFSAIGSLRILVVKSVVGVAVTSVFSVWLIPMWMVYGAVVVNLVANIIVFLVLLFAYLHDGRKVAAIKK